LSVTTHSSPHFAKPLLQVEPQTPPLQTAIPSAGASQTSPHPPQFEISFLVSMQLSSQAVNPLLQLNPQLPPRQTALPSAGASQRASQAPQ
jgi:hypothetical protein